MEPESAPPRVLISYSHDSTIHEARVLELSNRLRDDGIDSILDQYDTFPPQGWIRWMQQQVLQARFVLVVCTETYCRRAAGKDQMGTGLGATYESQLIQQILYGAGGVNEKFIPVVLTDEDRAHIPIELQCYTHYVLSRDAGYEELYRLLTNQPRVKQPVLGRLRALPPRQAKAEFRNVLWNLPSRNPWFTGRENDLQAIRHTLVQTNAAALGGIGGIGKTQTAIEYAHRYRREYQFALWSGEDGSTLLQSGFAALANTLDVPERNEKELSAVVGGVSRWLESHSGWLLIVDNIDTVEDLNIVRRLVPSGSSGHLLLTTRLQSTGRIAKLAELETMEPEEGALFLLRRCGLVEHEASLEAASKADRMLALRISNEVDGLPLALDQAGAFIEEMPSTPAEYLNLYQTEGARLRKLRGEVAAEHPSVTVTFSLAFSRLAAKNAAAADLLRVCAFLAPEAIPEDIFTQGGPELGERLGQLAGNPLDFAEAIRDAGKFALIRRNAAAKSLDMHRQVQEVLKDEMDPQTRRLWAERVVAALAAVFHSPKFQNSTQSERILPHARAAVRHIADLGLDDQQLRVFRHQAGQIIAGLDWLRLANFGRTPKLRVLTGEQAESFFQDLQGLHEQLRFVFQQVRLLPQEEIHLNSEFLLPFGDLLSKWKSIYHLEAEAKSLQFSMESDLQPDRERPPFWGDVGLIEQLLYNLVNNAVKYCYRGTNIHLGCAARGRPAPHVLSVTNYGRGMPATRSVYDLFWRGDESLQGLGVGLFLAYKIASAHGGTISHASARVSEYNVPLIEPYINAPRGVAGEAPGFRNVLATELLRLRASGEYVAIVAANEQGKARYAPFQSVFSSEIRQPTYKVVVSVDFPGTGGASA